MEGVLKIHLHSGQGVKDPCKFAFSGKTNPYVAFSCGISTSKSRVIENSLNPEWNSVHYLYIKKHSMLEKNRDQLVIDLYDYITHDRLGVCEKLCSPFDRQVHTGTATIPLDELRGPGTTYKEITIEQHKKRKSKPPVIKLSTQMLTVDEYCKELGRTCNSHWLDQYAVQNTTKSWSKLYQQANIDPVIAKPFAYFANEKSGTNAWLHVYEGIKTIVLAFRGTEVGEFADIISDIDILPDPLARLLKEPYAIAPNEALKQKHFIHRGFLNAYAAVHETILDTIYSITGWDEEWAILVTGHSLGGALAVLGAFEMTNRRDSEGKGPHVGMLNVGAPRVGSRKFVQSYNNTVSPSFRVVNDRDTIPTMPQLYAHVNKEVLVKPDGKLLIQNAFLQTGMERDAFKEYIAQEEYRKNHLSSHFSVHSVKGALAAEYHRQPYYFEVVQSVMTGFFKSFEKKEESNSSTEVQQQTGKA
eukprot:g2712.t1